MIGQVRIARPSITLSGVDYFSRLAPYLINMTYVDNCDGQKADDLSFELADRDGMFVSSWMPQKGAFLDAGIIVERWFSPIAASLSLDCGRFWIDSIEFKLPERTVTVKGTSIPVGVRLKASAETRPWEKATLRDIAAQISTENKMDPPQWLADSNPRYERTEQHEESCLAFLQKRAEDAKLAIRVHRNKIVVYDEQKLEQAAPSFTLLYGSGNAATPLGGVLGSIGSLLSGSGVAGGGAVFRLAGGHFTTNIADSTKSTKVTHVDPQDGHVKSGAYSAPPEGLQQGGAAISGGSTSGSSSAAGTVTVGEPEQDETYDRANQDPDSDTSDEGSGSGGLRAGSAGYSPPPSGLQAGDANLGSDTLAKAKTRKKNKHRTEIKVDLSLGNPLVAAGQTFNLKGVGQFDGKYIVTSAHHTVGPEYKTTLDAHRCLEGY
jgi:phage protein D